MRWPYQIGRIFFDRTFSIEKYFAKTRPQSVTPWSKRKGGDVTRCASSLGGSGAPFGGRSTASPSASSPSASSPLGGSGTTSPSASSPFGPASPFGGSSEEGSGSGGGGSEEGEGGEGGEEGTSRSRRAAD